MYLIDGHNLIGTNLLGFGLDDAHDEEKLILKLIGFSNGVQKKVTVVFDHGLPGGREQRTSLVTAVFASRPGIADDIMMHEIARTKDSERWTVVSADAAVREAAMRRKMRVISSPEFARLLRSTAAATTKSSRPADALPDDDPGSRANPFVPPAEVDDLLRAFSQPPPEKRR
jgi:predicted RNA-binding protein with PIN domain